VRERERESPKGASFGVSCAFYREAKHPVVCTVGLASPGTPRSGHAS
jgi:hypothetical protein